MLDKPIDQLAWSDLDALLASQRSEDRQLDVKRTLSGGKDGEARELLADVTSLANTDGCDTLGGQRLAPFLDGFRRLFWIAR